MLTMKAIVTTFLFAVFAVGLNAQYSLPVDFENPMEDTAWNQFSNAGDLPENMGMAENPAKDGINTSDSCLMYIVQDGADPWAGAYSDAYGSFEVTADRHVMEMMVYKDKISPCGLKLEQGGPDPIEVKVDNTVTGEWELLTFDLTDAIGNTYTRLTFFPDFPESRSEGGTAYIDNITWEGGTSVDLATTEMIRVYPNPASEMLNIRYPGMNRIAISNIVGQQVRYLEFRTTGEKVFDVSGLNTGVYFITLETADGTVSTKFIKE